MNNQTDVQNLPLKRKRGRPAQSPPWLKAAAQLVANGYTLRKALWRLRVSLPQDQLRRVYRWKLFREEYAAAKARFVEDWGGPPPRRAESITKKVLGEWTLPHI